MKPNQISIVETLRRVLSYLAANADALGGLAQSKPQQDLHDVVDEWTEVSIQRGVDAIRRKGLTHKLRRLRTALIVDHIRPIAAIAAKLQAGAPSLHTFRAPPLRTSAGELVAVASSIAEATRNHEDTFIGEGLHADFIPRLVAAAEAVRATSADRTATTARVVDATARLVVLARRGRQSLRVIDALAVSALADRPERLRRWALIRRLSHAKRGAVR